MRQAYRSGTDGQDKAVNKNDKKEKGVVGHPGVLYFESSFFSFLVPRASGAKKTWVLGVGVKSPQPRLVHLQGQAVNTAGKR